jgi:hypothetical protein
VALGQQVMTALAGTPAQPASAALLMPAARAGRMTELQLASVEQAVMALLETAGTLSLGQPVVLQ